MELGRPSAARLLLVDDDPRLLGLVAEHLRLGGHQVLTARDGAAALALLEAGGIDLAIVDLVLPGMDALELCQRLRAGADTAEVPVVLVTGAPRGDDVERASAAGANHLISKPYSLSGLSRVVSSLLQRVGA